MIPKRGEEGSTVAATRVRGGELGSGREIRDDPTNIVHYI
jgi:hypothetical protein